MLNTVNIKISSTKSESNLNETLYSKNSFITADIDNYKDSNIGINIDDYPFNFELFRKDELHEVLFNSHCKSKQNLLFYSKNYIQICSLISNDNYYFGFGNQGKNESLRINPLQTYVFFSNVTDSLPYFIAINPTNQTSYGVLLLNSGPMKVNIESGQMSYELINGVINFFVFNGPSSKEVITQMQSTISFPIIPYMQTIDWDYFSINSIEISNGIQFDDENISLSTISNYFINYADDYSSVFLNPTVISKELNDTSFVNYLFIHKANLLVKNVFLLNYLNIIGLIEGKAYFTNCTKTRSIILSTRTFILSNVYASKWINDIPFTYEGMKLAIKISMMQSIVGNPYSIITFNPQSLIDNRSDEELVIRWGQLLSFYPFASSHGLSIPTQIMNMRMVFNLYIYTYFITMSSEGGILFRPMIYDTKPKILINQILTDDKQIFFGSSILLIPITTKNNTNCTALFPEDKFYDFYSGEVINKNGEGKYIIQTKLMKMPIFLRGGKIVPLQLLDYPHDEMEQLPLLTTDQMKTKPIQILITLDGNFQATGKILIDDFESLDSRNKKNYYKMIITATQHSMDMSIFFRAYSFKYKIPEKLYQNSINKVVIYGFSKISVKKLAIINKNGRIELTKQSFSFSQSNDILIIQNISIPLNMDTKILIL